MGGALSSYLPRQAEAEPPASDTFSQSPWCAICGDFLDPENYSPVPRPWDDFVTSARSCVYCDAIVRGCRGWLDGSGRQDSTPLSLQLHPISQGRPRAGEQEDDRPVPSDGSEEDEVEASSTDNLTKIWIDLDFEETITLNTFAVEGQYLCRHR
jgi:hypothetical protein